MAPLSISDEELNSLTALAAALSPPLRDAFRQVAANVADIEVEVPRWQVVALGDLNAVSVGCG